MSEQKPIQIFSNFNDNIGVNVVKSPVKLTILEMLRYHDMWSELTEHDFEKDYVYNPDYPGYTGGCELSRDEFEVEEIELTPDLWVHDTVDAEFSERSLYWYEKIINLCKK